ncbi:hypothetical protein L195_g061817, partial [Trifolium pratense]
MKKRYKAMFGCCSSEKRGGGGGGE